MLNRTELKRERLALQEERLRRLQRSEQSRRGLYDKLLPAQRAQLGRSQAVPEGEQDHGRIAMSVPIAAGSFHQPFDLFLGQVLAGSIMPIWRRPRLTVLFTVVGARGRDAAFTG